MSFVGKIFYRGGDLGPPPSHEEKEPIYQRVFQFCKYLLLSLWDPWEKLDFEKTVYSLCQHEEKLSKEELVELSRKVESLKPVVSVLGKRQKKQLLSLVDQAQTHLKKTSKTGNLAQLSVLLYYNLEELKGQMLDPSRVTKMPPLGDTVFHSCFVAMNNLSIEELRTALKSTQSALLLQNSSHSISYLYSFTKLGSILYLLEKKFQEKGEILPFEEEQLQKKWLIEKVSLEIPKEKCCFNRVLFEKENNLSILDVEYLEKIIDRIITNKTGRNQAFLASILSKRISCLLNDLAKRTDLDPSQLYAMREKLCLLRLGLQDIILSTECGEDFTKRTREALLANALLEAIKMPIDKEDVTEIILSRAQTEIKEQKFSFAITRLHAFIGNAEKEPSLQVVERVEGLLQQIQSDDPLYVRFAIDILERSKDSALYRQRKDIENKLLGVTEEEAFWKCVQGLIPESRTNTNLLECALYKDLLLEINGYVSDRLQLVPRDIELVKNVILRLEELLYSREDERIRPLRHRLFLLDSVNVLVTTSTDSLLGASKIPLDQNALLVQANCLVRQLELLPPEERIQKKNEENMKKWIEILDQRKLDLVSEKIKSLIGG